VPAEFEACRKKLVDDAVATSTHFRATLGGIVGWPK